MIHVMHDEHVSQTSFEVPLGAKHAHSADLVDQLFNSSEKRLARILL